jgi:hypothetical protein
MNMYLYPSSESFFVITGALRIAQLLPKTLIRIIVRTLIPFIVFIFNIPFCLHFLAIGFSGSQWAVCKLADNVLAKLTFPLLTNAVRISASGLRIIFH